MPQVYDEHGLARAQLGLQFLRADSRDPQPAHEHVPADELDGQGHGECAAEDGDRLTAETPGQSRDLDQLLAEHVTQAEVEPDPERGADDIEHEEPEPRHAEHARERLADPIEAGQKFIAPGSPARRFALRLLLALNTMNSPPSAVAGGPRWSAVGLGLDPREDLAPSLHE